MQQGTKKNNLPELLDDLINQEYPLNKFEIIIVNDRSSDSTPEILKMLQIITLLLKLLTLIKIKIMTSKKMQLMKE